MLNMMRQPLMTLVMVVAGSTAAFAETPAEPIDAAKLDADGRTAVGMDFRFATASEGDESLSSAAFEVKGRVPIAGQFLLELTLPIHHTWGLGDSGTGLGNVDLAGRWVGRFPQGEGRELRLGIGGHVGLPTAADEDNGGVSSFLAAGMFVAIHPGFYLPNTTTLGANVSARFIAGQFFVQAQADLDHFLMEDNDDSQILTLRGVVGAAVTPELTLMAAVHSAFSFEDVSDQNYTALAFGAAVPVGQLELTAHVYLPLENFADPWGLGVGVAARF